MVVVVRFFLNAFFHLHGTRYQHALETQHAHSLVSHQYSNSFSHEYSNSFFYEYSNAFFGLLGARGARAIVNCNATHNVPSFMLA